jgi:hypothetical protein
MQAGPHAVLAAEAAGTVSHIPPPTAAAAAASIAAHRACALPAFVPSRDDSKPNR